MLFIRQNTKFFTNQLGMDELRLHPHENEQKEMADIILKTGTLLMSAGANTGRDRTTINRIAEAFGYSVHIQIDQRAIMLTMLDDAGSSIFTVVRVTPHHVINFRTISGISKMSWSMVEEQWSIHEINDELDRLEQLPRFPRWQVLTLVGLAGSGFCFLADGSYLDLAFTFVASFIGLFIRQESLKAHFNPYVSVYFAAFAASLIAGSASKLGLSDSQNHAFVTSVLFLIPGVPLSNAFSDIMDGNVLNGITRGFVGFLISFSIALGILTTALIYQF